MGDPYLKDDEERVLQRMLKIKESILTTIDIDKASAREKEILLKTVESIEGTIFKRTQLRSKQQDNQSAGDMRAMVVEILKRYQDKERPSTSNASVPSLPDAMVPRDFVDGEMDTGIVSIDYKEIVDDE